MKIRFILDGGFSEIAEVTEIPYRTRGKRYVTFKSGQKALIRLKDKNKIWEEI